MLEQSFSITRSHDEDSSLFQPEEIFWRVKQKKAFLKEGVKEQFPCLSEQPLLESYSGPFKQGMKPLNVAIVFSGGQAPGGHNVIWGLYQALISHHPSSKLYGVLNGPSGLIKDRLRLLTKDEIEAKKNCGGFHLLGSGREKIERPHEFDACLETIKRHDLDGVVIVGGDDSNTNAAFLAEFLQNKKSKACCVGVPKTIDGDLQEGGIEISFGFDTASRTYAHMIGSVAFDALSAKKYYHFIRLMGRSASHITLECALRTRVNMALIGEELSSRKQTLLGLVEDICALIMDRDRLGLNHGVILMPEGIFECLLETKTLIEQLHQKYDPSDKEQSLENMYASFTPELKRVWDLLPEDLKKNTLLEKDPHGNVPVSKIEIERLLINLVKSKLEREAPKLSFNAVPHFFGYEGRSCYPTNFDAHYCSTLGFFAFSLIRERHNGYIVVVKNLAQPPKCWRVEALPIPSLIHFEERKGKKKAVIRKTLVDLDSPSFLNFAKQRERWRLEDMYEDPGPIQFYRLNQKVFDPPLLLKLKV